MVLVLAWVVVTLVTVVQQLHLVVSSVVLVSVIDCFLWRVKKTTGKKLFLCVCLLKLLEMH